MHIIEGAVVHGDEIGRDLGFPTANIHMYDETVPDGVWAARVTVRGRVRPAVVSVGRRPTFFDTDNVRLFEAHIIDFSESIYGEWLVVELLDYIRGQVRFGSIQQLVSAMHTDLKKAKRIIESSAARERLICRLIRQEGMGVSPHQSLAWGHRVLATTRLLECVSSYRRAVNLIYAGWLPQDGVSAGAGQRLETSVAPTTRISTVGVAHSRVAGHSTRCLQQPRGGQGVARVSSCVYHRQRPALAGQLPRDRGIGRVRVLLPLDEPDPPRMEPAIALVSANTYSCRCTIKPGPQHLRREVSAAVVPRGLDQQATDVAVTGLRHPTLGP